MTPRQAGFYAPAEWARHEGTWLQWPHDETNPGEQMRLESIWLQMTEALHRHEIVHIVVTDEPHGEHLQHLVGYYGFDERQIDIRVIPIDDVWSRDNGPIFLMNERGELAVTAWNFNGWGDRFPHEKDREVPAAVAGLLDLPLFTAPITLEGGGVEVNGSGSLLATRSSIINPNRNPDATEEEIEDALREYLGVRHVIWLSGAPVSLCESIGDATDFHVDGAARFVDDSTVLYCAIDDAGDPFFPYLDRHRKELEEAHNESGKRLTPVPLPAPSVPLYSTRNTSTRPPFRGVLAPGVYTNYYVANGVVLVPVYGDVNDAAAKGIIAEHFPGREIVGLPANVVAELGGMMHCVTQQQPAV